MVIESPECDGAPIFPAGTRIEGHVLNVHRVGLGFRHETAALEVEFDEIQPEGAPPLEIRARLLGVDNAREHVRKGVISGIRSINSPQDHLSARVGYFLTWHPDTMLILPVYHAVFPVLPEPELYFPSGTDLLLKLSAPLDVTNLPDLPFANFGFAPAERADLDTMALSFPERTTTPKGRDADIVNVAFVGSANQLSQAFQLAGWERSETWSVPAVLGEIGAFAMERNNSIGPMSKQLLQGNPSDSTWEKGFDSLAKRDHLRIWNSSATWNGDSVWLSSSTQDIGATLSLRKARFVHAIDPNVDNERERIVLDLLLAGCVESVDRVKRPVMAHSLVNAVGTEMHTDGAIAVVRLKDCDEPVFRSDPEAPELTSRPPKFERYVRTQVLATRDMWRENVFYDAFNATRASVRAIRQSRANREAARRSLAAAMQTGPDPAMESEADTAGQSAVPSVSGLPEASGLTGEAHP
jgi:hypothetical protein